MLGTSVLHRLSACAALAVVLAPHAQAADPIKVGVVTPLSGTYAPIGKQVRWGAELAVKENRPPPTHWASRGDTLRVAVPMLFSHHDEGYGDCRRAD